MGMIDDDTSLLLVLTEYADEWNQSINQSRNESRRFGGQPFSKER
jgi:hypothetical protein